MNEQASLFGGPPADPVTTSPVQAREEAIQRADANADPDWRETAYGAVRAVARRGEDFTADDIWDELGGTDGTHEPSALGPVFLRASRAGLIAKTGRQVLSRNPRRHRDLAVWHQSAP